MARVVVFGTGNWAQLAHLYLTHDSPHKVVAFTVDREFARSGDFQGLPVVPFDEVNRKYPPPQFEMFIPMSFKKLAHNRSAIYYEAKEKGYRLISYVSSKATTWPGFVCGDNCFIFEDDTIQPFVEIGNK